MQKDSANGRTLVETLAVLVVIAILTLVALLGYKAVIHKYKKDATVKSVSELALRYKLRPIGSPGKNAKIKDIYPEADRADANSMRTADTDTGRVSLTVEDSSYFMVVVNEILQDSCEEYLNSGEYDAVLVTGDMGYNPTSAGDRNHDYPAIGKELLKNFKEDRLTSQQRIALTGKVASFTKKSLIEAICGSGDKTHMASFVFGDRCPKNGFSHYYSGKCWACPNNQTEDRYGVCCDKGQVESKEHCFSCGCPSGTHCDGGSGECVECTADSHCTGHAGKTHCDTSTHKCVGCMEDADCGDADANGCRQYCDPHTKTCSELCNKAWWQVVGGSCVCRNELSKGDACSTSCEGPDCCKSSLGLSCTDPDGNGIGHCCPKNHYWEGGECKKGCMWNNVLIHQNVIVERCGKCGTDGEIIYNEASGVDRPCCNETTWAINPAGTKGCGQCNAAGALEATDRPCQSCNTRTWTWGNDDTNTEDLEYCQTCSGGNVVPDVGKPIGDCGVCNASGNVERNGAETPVCKMCDENNTWNWVNDKNNTAGYCYRCTNGVSEVDVGKEKGQCGVCNNVGEIVYNSASEVDSLCCSQEPNWTWKFAANTTKACGSTCCLSTQYCVNSTCCANNGNSVDGVNAPTCESNSCCISGNCTNNHCCDEGQIWNGSQCVTPCVSAPAEGGVNLYEPVTIHPNSPSWIQGNPQFIWCDPYNNAVVNLHQPTAGNLLFYGKTCSGEWKGCCPKGQVSSGYCCPQGQVWDTTTNTCLEQCPTPKPTTSQAQCTYLENENCCGGDLTCIHDPSSSDPKAGVCAGVCAGIEEYGIVLVLDRSGSMGGSFTAKDPETQEKETIKRYNAVDRALSKLKVYTNTYSAVYEHDQSSRGWKRLAWGEHSIADIKNAVFNYSNGGGTGFSHAFKRIENDCKGKQKFVILWLTDGQVNSDTANLKKALKNSKCPATLYMASTNKNDEDTYSADRWTNITSFSESFIKEFNTTVGKELCVERGTRVTTQTLGLRSCPAGQGYYSGKCNDCSTGAVSCDWGETKCQTGYCPSKNGKACNALMVNAYCDSKQTNGISCNAGYYLQSNTCKPCVANAASCTGATSGIKCKAGFYKDKSACKSCPANATCADNKITCKAGWYEKDNACLACVANAASCTGATAGIKCKAGFYKDGTACKSCPDDATCAGGTASFCCSANFYKNGKVCKACSGNKTTKGKTCQTSSSACKS